MQEISREILSVLWCRILHLRQRQGADKDTVLLETVVWPEGEIVITFHTPTPAPTLINGNGQ